MLTHIEELFSTPTGAALLIGGVGLVVVMVLVPLVISRCAPLVAHLRDKQLHQTHQVPVPRLGGIALAAAFVVVLVGTFWVQKFQPGGSRLVLGLSSLAMFGLGLWDDLIPLGAKKKLVVQVLIAAAAFYFGLRIDEFKNPLTGVIYSLGPWACVATVFWLVAMTNLINLIDGIDGLATGICLMLMCLLVYVSFHGQPFSLCIATGMVGALVGFLRFNFPPARIYLGDGGAYFLGFLIGALTIQNSNKGTIAAALIAPIFALALPILDVSFSIVRRGMKGLPIFRPDRSHIHHRLLQAGFSRRRAVLTLYSVSLVFLALAFAAFWSNGKLTPILIGCSFVILLIALPSLGIIKNWLTIGAVFGNSLEMRKEIQYALLLRTWLELEADRCESIETLWQDFTFVANKLGFTEATLCHDGEECSWIQECAGESHEVTHQLHVGKELVSLEVRAPIQRMDSIRFQIVSDLAAETWLNASRRWTQRHEIPFELPRTTTRTTAVSDSSESVAEYSPSEAVLT